MTAHPARRIVAAAAVTVLAGLGAAAPAPAATGAFGCDASAVRGTVLGGAGLEPVTANRGAATCAPRSATLPAPGLPLPLAADAVVARTTLTGTAGQVATQAAGAAGGVAELRVQTLPELPLRLPDVELPASLGAVAVPGYGAIDVRPALEALLPDGRLPRADVLRVRSAVAYAQTRCAGAAPELTGSAQVAGIEVLGQDLGFAGKAVERAVTLVGSGSVDPSSVDVAKLDLPAALDLLPAAQVQAILQPVLDAIPAIEIPAALAEVRVTPGEQVRTAGALTQRALRLRVAVLGQTLADLVVGEATVRAEGVDCATPAAGAAPGAPTSVAAAALECTTRRLVLIDVLPSGRRVKLLGAADRSLIGRRVRIVASHDGRTVAQPTVGADGQFSATAPLPPRSVRSTNRARYQAVLGRERSLRLKLLRRLRLTSLRAAGGRVTIAGRVVAPLARPVREVVVTRRVSCRRSEVVRRFRPRRDGTFRVTVPAPEGALAAVYRMRTVVRRSRSSRKTYPTFTLPRAVELR